MGDCHPAGCHPAGYRHQAILMADQLRLFEVSLEDALAQTREIMSAAKAKYQPSRTFLLFSGGNDSLVLLDALAGQYDEIVHINTGIGIPETTDFARRTAAGYRVPFTEMTPPDSYEHLVLNNWGGMPGPGAHYLTYQRLKERCVMALLRHHRTFRGERFMLLTGVRQAESVRRMGYKDPVNRTGGQVWVNPLLFWSHANMAEYRSAMSLPVNEVAVHLHMSGECLCGAMASQGPAREERELIRFFYPDFDNRLTALEQECRNKGLRWCEWGMARGKEPKPAGQLCQSCEFRQLSLMDMT
jgi:3'-phosphoadenosine 5'-phosphosulfate sulfotransferase (PAPS reductase)/FAD synthetase